MNRHSLINSLLLTVCVAVSGWVAHKTAETAERAAAMTAALDAVKESARKSEQASADTLNRLERKLDDMVPRREFDAKFLALETEQRKGDIRLREIDLEILKLKQGLK